VNISFDLHVYDIVIKIDDGGRPTCGWQVEVGIAFAKRRAKVDKLGHANVLVQLVI